MININSSVINNRLEFWIISFKIFFIALNADLITQGYNSAVDADTLPFTQNGHSYVSLHDELLKKTAVS